MNRLRHLSGRKRAALCVLLLAAAAGGAALVWPSACLRGAAWLLPPVPAEAWLRVPPGAEMTDRAGRPLHGFLDAEGQWRFPRTLDQISSRVVEATLAAEDKRFWSHPGVDPRAVARAAWLNLTRGRIASGASTLTMQVVKNAEKHPRSWAAKASQALTALRLERAAPKRGILEAYLNNAPYGRNLVGVEAAARRWFGKPAAELSLPEAALLAGLPKSPTGYDPLTRPDRALLRRNQVLRLMAAAGVITASEAEEALDAPLGASWHDFPQLAPHLAARVTEDAREKGRVETTLDAGIQAEAEAAVAKHLLRFDGRITNGAVIVADVAGGTMLARVGSAGFFNDRIAGQVDLCTRPRSPGSTLKPFAYALAMEKNLLYASEMLLDDDLDFGQYHPSNFDGGVNGLVSAKEALRLSLNIPAVQTLDRVGTKELLAFLRGAGMTTLTRGPDDYGLGLVLGGAEVTLESLAGAYLALARLGEARPLTWRQETAGEGAAPLVSRGTALALWDMLEQPLPGELEQNLVSTGLAPARVCWKTGTSAGFHDAWAVVFNAHYLVAVWMGNNDGKASPDLVGARAALPLAARIFRGLPAKNTAAWPDAAGELVHVDVCADSGLPASPCCGATRSVLLPRGQYLHRRCAVHQPAPDGREGGIEYWPASPVRWDLARLPRRAPSAEGDGGEGVRRLLAITSPADRAEFVLSGTPGGDRVPLKASHQEATPLHWYVNGKYLGESSPGSPLVMDLAAGTSLITCMTPAGDTAKSVIHVTGG